MLERVLVQRLYVWLLQLERRQIIQLLMSKDVTVDLATALVTEQWEQAQASIDARSNLVTELPLLLHYTIQKGLIAATTWLLAREVDINFRAAYLLDDYLANLTPLHAAIESECVEIAQMLLESGADVNTKTTGELELTPLHGAAAIGNLALIQLLVKHQADLNARDNVYNYKPLDWAKEFEQQEAVELLKQLATEKL